MCGQCHVEYYFKGPGKVVTYPWANGLKVEEIEAYYEKEGFTDWVHAETGTKVLKAQHPGVRGVESGRARPGRRGLRGLPHALRARRRAEGERPLGAEPAAESQPRLPDLSRGAGEGARGARARRSRTATTRCSQRAAQATTDMLDAIVAAKKAGARRRPTSRRPPPQHRKAQWRLDFVAAENSMGFHAPQELARILGEVIDHARQGQLEAERATRKR